MKTSQEILKSVVDRIDFLTKEQNELVSKLINVNNLKKQYETAVDNSVGALLELKGLKDALEKELNEVDKDQKEETEKSE